MRGIVIDPGAKPEICRLPHFLREPESSAYQKGNAAPAGKAQLPDFLRQLLR